MEQFFNTNANSLNYAAVVSTSSIVADTDNRQSRVQAGRVHQVYQADQQRRVYPVHQDLPVFQAFLYQDDPASLLVLVCQQHLVVQVLLVDLAYQRLLHLVDLERLVGLAVLVVLVLQHSPWVPLGLECRPCQEDHVVRARRLSLLVLNHLVGQGLLVVQLDIECMQSEQQDR